MKLLPFSLTNAQRRVLSEIKEDMMSPHPMHRLVQGDVGCGKFRGFPLIIRKKKWNASKAATA